MDKIRLATLNCQLKINSGILHILDMMKTENIDVLLLQEVGNLSAKSLTLLNQHFKGVKFVI